MVVRLSHNISMLQKSCMVLYSSFSSIASMKVISGMMMYTVNKPGW